MAVVSERRSPTIDDARAAARHLSAVLDPAEVLLFGSVARGTQDQNSDLDLILVFDDLDDYANRRKLAVRAMDAVAEVTGVGCDVRITDRPEWETRTRRCASTFEAHIASHAITLATRPPRSAIHWDKDIGMAPTDEQQAAASLENTVHALNSLLPLLRPSAHESDALSAGDARYADDMRHSRLLNVCAQAQAAMEAALKALIHALKGPHPENIHSIGGLIAAAGEHLADVDAEVLGAALGPVSPVQASIWRQTGTYPADLGIVGDPSSATEEFAARMSAAAVGVTKACIKLIEAELGHRPPAARPALAQCDRINQELSSTV